MRLSSSARCMKQDTLPIISAISMTGKYALQHYLLSHSAAKQRLPITCKTLPDYCSHHRCMSSLQRRCTQLKIPQHTTNCMSQHVHCVDIYTIDTCMEQGLHTRVAAMMSPLQLTSYSMSVPSIKPYLCSMPSLGALVVASVAG